MIVANHLLDRLANAGKYMFSTLFPYFLDQARAWFLDIDLVREVRVCLCVRPRG